MFDTDGVLLDSAYRHAAAWKQAFDACLPQWEPHAEPRPQPFDAVREYRDLVDGRSRLDGARAFLGSRHISLPEGTPNDPPGCSTVQAVAARKEDLFQRMLQTETVQAYAEVRPMLVHLRKLEIRCAAVSASRHARPLLQSAGLIDFFEALVDGQDAAALALPGKPDPALFLEAANRLGAEPSRAAVVEDALAGVEAGRRGGFRLVVGLDRDHDPTTADGLTTHGAHLVLPDMSGLPAALQSRQP
ncbi:HAD-IA family hydrolase [Streptomyces sp. SID14478]|uniref:HAD family hydrolase n=1 Tax=Streptomyces sp. SID14478 TaxID=2706073 RepID=UPI0031BB34FA